MKNKTYPITSKGKIMKNKLKPGNYWAAVWPNGKQLWGDTVRRNCERAAKGTSAKIIQRPKN